MGGFGAGLSGGGFLGDDAMDAALAKAAASTEDGSGDSSGTRCKGGW